MQPLSIFIVVSCALVADLAALVAAHRRTNLPSRAGVLADGVVVLLLALAFGLGFGNFEGAPWLKLLVHDVPIALKGGLAAFPLGYFAARLALSRMPADWLDAARLMGLTELDLLWRLVLPAEWPALATGALLSLLSALAIASHSKGCNAIPAMMTGLAVGILLMTLLGLARPATTGQGELRERWKV